MKQFILIFASAFCFFSASAQEDETPKISLECSAGLLPTETPGLVFFQPFGDSYDNIIADMGNPTVNLSVYYQTFKRISFGASFTYSQGNYVYRDSYLREIEYGYALACMFGLKVDILQFGAATLYSSAEIGSSINLKDPTLDSDLLATQVTIMGLRIGNDLYGKMELGCGAKGVMQFGVGYRF